MMGFGRGLLGALEEAEAQQEQEDLELEGVLEEDFGKEQDQAGIQDMQSRAAAALQKAGGTVRRAPVPGVDPMSAFFKGGGASGGGMLKGMVKGKMAGGGGPSRAMFGSPAGAAGKGAAKGAMKGMGAGGPVGAVLGRAILGYLGAKFKNSSAVTGPMTSAGEAASSGEGVLQRQLAKIAKRADKDKKVKATPLKKEETLEEETLDDNAEFLSHLGNMFLGGL